MTDIVLAYLHFIAILTMTVFLSAEAALCRSEWMNAATVRRLARVDLIYGAAALLVLLTGLARLLWGGKGWAWYAHNPLFHLKVSLFVLMAAMSVRPTITFLRWRRQLQQDAAFVPPPAAVVATRRRIMISAHLLLLLPLLGVLLARGWGRQLPGL